MTFLNPIVAEMIQRQERELHLLACEQRTRRGPLPRRHQRLRGWLAARLFSLALQLDGGAGEYAHAQARLRQA